MRYPDEAANITGSAIVLAMYFWITNFPVSSSGIDMKLAYQTGNLVGASLLAYGLRKRSKAACILNVAWSLIALQSIVRSFI